MRRRNHTSFAMGKPVLQDIYSLGIKHTARQECLEQ